MLSRSIVVFLCMALRAAFAQAPPTVDGPAITGSSAVGSGQIFTVQYSDPNGLSGPVNGMDLAEVRFWAADGSNAACNPSYEFGSFYLQNDAGNGLIGPLSPGSGSLSNSYCTISNPTVSDLGNQRTLTLPIAFTSAFMGTHIVKGYVSEYSGLNSGWVPLGNWTVTTSSTWAKRRPITIAHSQVSGSTALTNFPMLFSSPDPDFKTTENGGSVGRNDGKDIYFTDASGNKLNHELELYDGTAGRVIAWLQVPSVSPVSDTTLYVCYGNASAADQQSITGTWDSNYKGVWHLPTPAGNDSTSNVNNGTNHGATAVSGKVDGAGGFSSAYIDMGTGSSISSLQVPMTISGWFNSNNGSATQTIFGQYQDTLTRGDLVKLIRLDGGTTLTYYFSQSSGSNFQNFSYSGSLAPNTWHYFAVVMSGSVTSPSLSIAVDGGVAQTFTPTALYASPNTGLPSRLGNSNSGVQFNAEWMSGFLDEIRISGVARSADWIKTEYNNQNSPGTFYTLGSSSGGGGNPPAQVTLSSPASGATNQSTTPTLSWSASTGATSYDLYLGTSNPPGVYAQGLAGTSFTVSAALSSGTTYYWNVVAKNSAGSAPASTTWPFATTMSLPGQVTLTSPANGATNQSTTPTLSWSASSGATSYDLYLGTSSPPAVYAQGLGSTSFTVSAALSTGTTYYWNVVAKNSAGSAQASTTWSFSTTTSLPGQVTLNSPATGSTSQSTTPALSWSASTGASSYDLYLGTSNPPAIYAQGLTSTSYTVSPALNAGTTYYWYVVARNSAGSAPASSTWSFTTAWSGGGGSCWSINNGCWSKRKPITINPTGTSAALPYFPVLFSSTDPDFRHTANGGFVCRNDGKDIFFTNASGAKLNHELESYDAANGIVIAWVQVPNLPSGGATLYVYFGNASSGDQQSVNATWDANYKGVWHLPTPSGSDSTSNANNGTNHGATAVSGKVGWAGGFSGAYIDMGTGSSINSLQVPMTISGWFNSNNGSATQTIFGQYQDTLTRGDLVKLIRLDGGTTLTYYFSQDSGGNFQNFSYAGSLAPNTWHYFAVVMSGSVTSPSLLMAVDGAAAQTFTPTALYASPDTGLPSRLGNSNSGVQFNAEWMSGSLDEIRISNIDRSADWIKAEYNNQNAPTSFYNLGASQSGSGGGAGTTDLIITSNHAGTFTQGQTGTYLITVANAGPGSTDGSTVTVTAALSSGLTATAIAGSGWTCTLSSLSCTRTDSVASGNIYAIITLTVAVATGAPASATNTATVSGGGDNNPSNNTAVDPTTINATPSLDPKEYIRIGGRVIAIEISH